MLGSRNLFKMVDSSYLSLGTSISRKCGFTVISLAFLCIRIDSHIQISRSEITIYPTLTDSRCVHED
jgi:hypothetical protein